MSLVFDSSALLALLRDETGADAVNELIEEADVNKCAHALNLCEVFYRIMGIADFATAQASIETLKAAGIEERGDMDAVFWRDVAALIADRRREKQPLALGDAVGVALARRLDADFVTADRSELEAVRAAGACRIIYIR